MNRSSGRYFLAICALVFVGVVPAGAAEGCEPSRWGADDEIGAANYVTPEQVMDVPVALFGTTDEMCAQLEQRRERWGLSYHCVQLDALDAIAPVVERLAGT